jgi:hypothetical protein
MKKYEDNKEYYYVYNPLNKAIPVSNINQEKTNPFTLYRRNLMHPLFENYLHAPEASNDGPGTCDLLTSYPTPYLKRNDNSFFFSSLERGINKKENFYKIPSHRISDDVVSLAVLTKAVAQIKRSSTELSLKDKGSSIIDSFSLLTHNAISLRNGHYPISFQHYN